MSTRSAFVAVAALVTAGVLTACSLLTSLDGLTGGPATDDAGRDTATSPVEGGGGDGVDALCERRALRQAARLLASRGDQRHHGEGRDRPQRRHVHQLAAARAAGRRRKQRREAAEGHGRANGRDDGQLRIHGQRSVHYRALGEARGAQGLPVARRHRARSARTARLVAPRRRRRQAALRGLGLGGDGGENQTRGLLVSDTPLTPGAFTHIVLAYTGSFAMGYLNGVPTTMFNTTSTCPPAGPLLWGCRGDLLQCLDDWVIDELAVYDFALDGARVAAHYALEK